MVSNCIINNRFVNAKSIANLNFLIFINTKPSKPIFKVLFGCLCDFLD